MERLHFPLEKIDPAFLDQLTYSLAFASEGLASHRIDPDSGLLEVDLVEGADQEEVERKVRELVERYQKTEFGFKSETYYEHRPELTPIDVWNELLRRRWVTQVGEGHVVLRAVPAKLLRMMDQVIVRDFAVPCKAREEIYPTTILARTLDRCDHFASFPEHIDFVAHLRPDVEVLKDFADACKQADWHQGLHDDRMALPEFAVSPSCCYHCYEGMEGWELDPPGICITAVLPCHRFEGSNHQTLARLRNFHMREVIWVGHPKYVLERRAEADERIIGLAKRWGMNCAFETANDMFFTDDYSVKASFQRQQEGKKELRALIPQDGVSVSTVSSNFHSTTFGKAFGISVGGRPAASGCLGWGLERFVWAILSQFGLDTKKWPDALRDDFLEFCDEEEEGEMGALG